MRIMNILIVAVLTQTAQPIRLSPAEIVTRIESATTLQEEETLGQVFETSIIVADVSRSYYLDSGNGHVTVWSRDLKSPTNPDGANLLFCVSSVVQERKAGRLRKGERIVIRGTFTQKTSTHANMIGGNLAHSTLIIFAKSEIVRVGK